MAGDDGRLRDPRYARALRGVLERQARRTRGSLQLLGDGLRIVPELRALKLVVAHARDLVGHYDAVVSLYESATGESVEPVVLEDLRHPHAGPSSWYEFAVARFLHQRAALFASAEHEDASFPPLAQLARRIAREERTHQASAERTFVELGRSRAFDDQKASLFDAWLRVSLALLAEAPEGDARLALELGLRRRAPAEVTGDFLQSIKPAVKAAGISFPPAAELGAELPPGLALDLEAVDETLAEGYEDRPDDRQTLAGFTKLG